MRLVGCCWSRPLGSTCNSPSSGSSRRSSPSTWQQPAAHRSDATLWCTGTGDKRVTGCFGMTMFREGWKKYMAALLLWL